MLFSFEFKLSLSKAGFRPTLISTNSVVLFKASGVSETSVVFSLDSFLDSKFDVEMFSLFLFTRARLALDLTIVP